MNRDPIDKDAGYATAKALHKSAAVNAKYVGTDEQKVWNDFRSGDESAFIFIYSTYFYELISFGLQFSLDKQLVEDCVQDLFIHIRRKRENLSPIKSSIRLYLFQALKRLVLDYKKKLRTVDLQPGREEYLFEVVMPREEHIINEQAYREKSEQLAKAIGRLTARQREAIYYLYYKSMTYEEIRIMMGLDNVKSARNLIYKAIAAMRPYIEYFSLILAFIDLFPSV